MLGRIDNLSERAAEIKLNIFRKQTWKLSRKITLCSYATNVSHLGPLSAHKSPSSVLLTLDVTISRVLVSQMALFSSELFHLCRDIDPGFGLSMSRP